MTFPLNSTARIDLDVPESYLHRRLPNFLRSRKDGETAMTGPYIVVETLVSNFGFSDKVPCGRIGWYLADGTPDTADGALDDHYTIGSIAPDSALWRAAEFVNFVNDH
jgi:hypothetical protein